jgi:hypothetical protein
MHLTDEDFIEFFQEKKSGTYKCPFCANEEFVLNADGDVPGLLRVDTAKDGEDPDGYHEFYSFACTNCGRSDFFHYKQVNQWLTDRGKK